MITNEVFLHKNKVWTITCPVCRYKMIVKHKKSEKCKCNILWSVVYYAKGIQYVEKEIEK